MLTKTRKNTLEMHQGSAIHSRPLSCGLQIIKISNKGIGARICTVLSTQYDSDFNNLLIIVRLLFSHYTGYLKPVVKIGQRTHDTSW